MPARTARLGGPLLHPGIGSPATPIAITGEPQMLAEELHYSMPTKDKHYV